MIGLQVTYEELQLLEFGVREIKKNNIAYTLYKDCFDALNSLHDDLKHSLEIHKDNKCN